MKEALGEPEGGVAIVSPPPTAVAPAVTPTVEPPPTPPQGFQPLQSTNDNIIIDPPQRPSLGTTNTVEIVHTPPEHRLPAAIPAGPNPGRAAAVTSAPYIGNPSRGRFGDPDAQRLARDGIPGGVVNVALRGGPNLPARPLLRLRRRSLRQT
jgi:hypothetical protein